MFVETSAPVDKEKGSDYHKRGRSVIQTADICLCPALGPVECSRDKTVLIHKKFAVGSANFSFGSFLIQPAASTPHDPYTRPDGEPPLILRLHNPRRGPTPVIRRRARTSRRHRRLSLFQRFLRGQLRRPRPYSPDGDRWMAHHDMRARLSERQ